MASASENEKKQIIGCSKIFQGNNIAEVTSDGELKVLDTNINSVISTNTHTGNSELRVYQENHVCSDNTTAVLLGPNETFTGGWQYHKDYQEIDTSIYSDQDSAINGLIFQWSATGVGDEVHDTDPYSYYSASGGTPYAPPPQFLYFRIKYTNGGTGQTVFYLTSVLRKSMTGGSFHKIDSTLKDDNDGRLVVAVNKLKTSANTYVSQTATTAGNAKISLEELESGISDDTKTKLKVSPYLVDEFGVVSRMLCDNVYGGAPIIIDIDHHEIHCGDRFVVTRAVDLVNGAADTIIVNVPNEAIKRYHLYVSINTEAEAEHVIYEGATTVSDGTTITSYNRERNSSLTSSLVFTHTPNTPSGGTAIYTEHWGSGKSAGAIVRGEDELVLKNNTKYRFVVTNSTTSNNYISWRFEYYIHPGI